MGLSWIFCQSFLRRLGYIHVCLILEFFFQPAFALQVISNSVLISVINAPVAGSPVIFFTDLDSGPNTGGENNQGAWVTLYGKNFGSIQGSVTFGGGAVAAVKFWTDTKIAVQLGSAAKTGLVSVNGNRSAVSFTVRAGNIRCVATTGNNSGNGLWPNCWTSVKTAIHSSSFLPGDIVYVRAGVVTTGADSSAGGDGVLGIRRGSASLEGQPGKPLALLGYPGEKVVIGAITDATAIEVKNYSDQFANYWTIANLSLQGVTAMGISGGSRGNTGWRVVGNDMYCPNFVSSTGDSGAGSDACFEADLSTNMVFYGNRVHDVGINKNGSKFGHALYWSTDSNHIDVGWNEVGPSKANRGIQFHSSPITSGDGSGHQQFDLHVHDNYVHDVSGDGINFATVDPSKGVVEAYNNLIVRAGTGAGPDYSGGNGINMAQILNAGIGCRGSCNVQIYNNTIYASGKFGGGAIGFGSKSFGGPVTAWLRNNLVYQGSGQIYFGEETGTIDCNKNLFFGGSGPMGVGSINCTNNLTSDPQFVLNFTDFHLKTASPAYGTGISSACPKTNFDGSARVVCNLGAY